MTPSEFAETIAAEVRAEMGRQRKTQADLSRALGITAATAARRLDTTAPFDTVELSKVAIWLGVPPEQFYPRTTDVVA
jgi:transcriptional regulator with XRE-family HTH domain